MDETGPHEEGVEQGGVIASMGRRWRQSLLLIAACCALGLVGSLLWPERWTARVELGITDPRGSSVFTRPGTFPQEYERYTLRQAELIETQPVYRKVSELVEGLSSDEFARDVEASTDVVGLVVVQTRGGSATRAVELATAVATAYGQVTAEITQDRARRSGEALDATRQTLLADISEARLDDGGTQGSDDARVASLTATLNLLDLRASELTVDARAYGDGLDFVDSPRRPSRPEEPQPVRNTVAAGFAGFLLAAAAAWVRGGRESSEQLEEPAGVLLAGPLLGRVPALGRRSTASLDEPAAAAFRAIADTLEQEVPSGVVLFTAAGRREGTTTTAAHVAAAAAGLGRSVALVDADTRSAGLTRLLLGAAGTSTTGLADAARGLATAADATRLVSFQGVALPLVSRGSAMVNPSAMFRSARTATLVAELRETYDLVVVDCPALLAVADAVRLAALADAVVLVVGASTSSRALEASAQVLEVLPTPLAGYVSVARRPAPRPRAAPARRPSTARRPEARPRRRGGRRPQRR